MPYMILMVREKKNEDSFVNKQAGRKKKEISRFVINKVYLLLLFRLLIV